MRKKTSWILPAVFALLVLVVMILIYYFSSENGLHSLTFKIDENGMISEISTGTEF